MSWQRIRGVLLFRRLNLKLKDKAYDLYKNNEEGNWDAFKITLSNAFHPRRDSAIVVSEMQRLTQGRNESVERFGDRILKKLEEVKQANEIKYHEEAIRDAFNEEHGRITLMTFRDGLKDPLRILVKAARDATIGAAILTAKDEEERVVPISNNNISQPNYSG